MELSTPCSTGDVRWTVINQRAVPFSHLDPKYPALPPSGPRQFVAHSHGQPAPDNETRLTISLSLPLVIEPTSCPSKIKPLPLGSDVEDACARRGRQLMISGPELPQARSRLAHLLTDRLFHLTRSFRDVRVMRVKPLLPTRKTTPKSFLNSYFKMTPTKHFFYTSSIIIIIIVYPTFPPSATKIRWTGDGPIGSRRKWRSTVTKQ